MAYRMAVISENVRVGRMSSGDLDIEVWETPYGWEPSTAAPDDDMTEVVIPSDALEHLFEYLR